MKNRLPTIAGLLAMFSLVATTAQSDEHYPQDDAALLASLRAGGYSLYFRHEATDWTQSDTIGKTGDWLSCDGSKIRQLSPRGRERAAATGLAIRSLQIPVVEVLASPYCRTMDSARLMNLGRVSATSDVINLRVADYFGGRAAVLERAQALLARPPASGGNRLVVAHGNIARALTQQQPDEGEALVFEANGNGDFDLIGRFTAEKWLSLSAVGPD